MTSSVPSEQSFKRLWDEAEIKFQNLTKTNLRSLPKKRLDDVIQELEGKYAEAETGDDEGDKSRAKDLVQNVLNCIKLLGGLAAEGASIVFGPANLCFNAVSFLIDIPVKVNKLYDGLAELFARVSTFLKTFKIYRRIEEFAKVDLALKQTTHKLLISFVTICALSIKVLGRSRFGRAKVVAKLVLFDDDSGVEAELSNFKKLVEANSQISDAVTLEVVLKSHQDLNSGLIAIRDKLNEAADESGRKLTVVASGVETLVNAENERKLEKQHQDHVNTLLKKLSIKMETIQASDKLYQDMRAENVRETGNWLENLREYKNWANVRSESGSLFIVSGGEKSGKSFLLTNMIHAAISRSRESISDTTRTSIAYYYFPVYDEKLSKDSSMKINQSITSALKSISIQIAKRSSQYAKEMAALAEKEDETWRDMSCKELWSTLQLKTLKRDLNYVLFFDGLDQIEEEKALELMEVLIGAESPKLRVMVSARTEFVDKCMENYPDQLSSVFKIGMEENNATDVRHFVEHQMAQSELLQGDEDETVELLNDIKNSLPQLSHGSYSILRRRLDAITGAISADRSADEIREHLREESVQTESTVAQATINDLNASLESHEILQLNELLAWAIYGRLYFTVPQLKAVLFLFYDRTPAKTIERKLTGVYRKVFTIDSDGDVVVDSEIEKLLKESPRLQANKQAEDSAEPLISMTITINKADVNTVRRFLWDLNEKANFGKRFPFDEFLTESQIKPKINANPADAQFVIMKQSIKLLMAEPDSKTKVLVPYVVWHFPYHLQDLRDHADKGEIENEQRREIGQSLVSLLSDVEFIEKHWISGHDLEIAWLRKDFVEKTLPAWLLDSAAMAGLGVKYARWVKQALSSSKPGVASLKAITLVIARHWLCDRGWHELTQISNWISTFIEREYAISPSDADAAEADDSDDGHELVDLVEAKSVEGDNDERAKNQGINGETTDNEPVQGATDVNNEETFNNDAAEDGENDDDSSGNEPTEDTETLSRIRGAADWVEKELKLETKNSLWFERLGHTFLGFGLTIPAKESFQTALAMSNPHWKCQEGLALVYEQEQNLELAISEMTSAVSDIRKDQEESLREPLIENLKRIAGWHVDLQQLDKAISIYEEVLQLGYSDYSSCWRLLSLLASGERSEKAIEFLTVLSQQTTDTKGLNPLAELLLNFPEDDFDSIDWLFSVTQRTKIFTLLLDSMLQALDLARKRDDERSLAYLLLFYGVAVAHHNLENKRPEVALTYWEELCEWGFSKYGAWIDAVRLAARFISTYHFAKALAAQNDGKDSTMHVSYIEQLMSRVQNEWFFGIYGVGYGLRAFLASYHARTGHQDQARAALRNDMRDALNLLSDDDPDNDWEGYLAMADVLTHVGDDLDALSAWSLLSPHALDEADVAAEAQDGQDIINANLTGDMNNRCDGRCGRTWTYADDIYVCKICPDVQFESGCLEKLRAGTLRRYICSPDHDWLHVPAWSYDIHRQIGKGNVMVGGELVDGQRVGGHPIPIEDWKESIREKWQMATTGEYET